jgi:holo-[acyl-carrier protein] synthase
MAEGIGTDIVSVPRIEALVRTGGRSFLRRWFTAEEIAYCTSKAVPERHLAARFAAKEAVVKAFPEPWDGPLPWRCIEIVARPRLGPDVRLTGAIAEAGNRAGIRDIRVSLSHCDEYATAVALIRVRTRHDRIPEPHPDGPGGSR